MTSSLVCDVVKSLTLFENRLKTYVCFSYVWADSLWKRDVQGKRFDPRRCIKSTPHISIERNTTVCSPFCWILASALLIQRTSTYKPHGSSWKKVCRRKAKMWANSTERSILHQNVILGYYKLYTLFFIRTRKILLRPEAQMFLIFKEKWGWIVLMFLAFQAKIALF